MGINERREREKQELRKKILTTAKDILLKEGWAQLSIRNIAAGVEYSPATIYLYFDGKDEIVYELMEMGFSQMMGEMHAAFLEPHPVKRIHEAGVAFIEFGLSNPEWFELLFNTPEPVGDLEKYLKDSSPGFRLFDQLVQTCEETIERGFTHITDAKILTMLLWSGVQGLVSLIQSKHIEHLIDVDEQTLIERTIDAFIGSLFLNYKP